MLNRLFVAPLALAGALLGASAAGLAQAAPPAPSATGLPPAPQNADGSPAGGMHRGHSKLRAILASLNLTDDQRAQIKGFMKSFRDSKQTTSPETRKQMMAQIEGVLTPDQQTQFEAQLHARPNAGGAPGGEAPQGNPAPNS